MSSAPPKKIQIPNNFTPRDYQLPFLIAFDSKKHKYFDLVMHRRAGKDKICMAILAKEMLQRVGGYYYVFPEFNQGRKALWDNLDNDGFRTLEHIASELWTNKSDQQMKLTIKNGSYLQVVGSSDVDRLIGTNPVGIVYSEWSLQDPKVEAYLDPILRANGGWAIYNYTPRGANHAKKFHEYATSNKEFYSTLVTVSDSKLFSVSELDNIRNRYIAKFGDDTLFKQEYYCDFNAPVQGAYYVNQVEVAEQERRIGTVAYNPELGVYTAHDLGASDSHCIWFFQVDGSIVNFVDYYETHGAGMAHIRDKLREKEYKYIAHFLPHDADHKQQGKDEVVQSRADMLRELGIQNVEVLPVSKSVLDDIQIVRGQFGHYRFDSDKCARGLLCIREYKKSWSDKNQMWSDLPAHDWASHGADALRYAALAVQKLAGTTITIDSQDVDLTRFDVNMLRRSDDFGYEIW